jgi:KipI family sensor histidine kinase inhibitor
VSSLPRILPCGDAALAVEFGSTIDPRLNAKVLALDARLGATTEGVPKVPGVVETVPTYRSLLVHYDPVVIGFEALSSALVALCEDLPDEPAVGRLWRIPVVYGGAFGIDLAEVADRHGLTQSQVIDRHAAPIYRVYMIGFVPGYAYLGGLDPVLATPRRETPRTNVPAGTISIGGIQAVVASIEAPSGWHLLGRTPVRNFMPNRNPNFLIEAGDRVRFESIDAARWDALDREAAAGEPVAEVIE